MNFKVGDLVKPKCNKHIEWMKIGIIIGPVGRHVHFPGGSAERARCMKIYWNTGTLELWSMDSVKKWLDKA